MAPLLLLLLLQLMLLLVLCPSLDSFLPSVFALLLLPIFKLIPFCFESAGSFLFVFGTDCILRLVAQ